MRGSGTITQSAGDAEITYGGTAAGYAIYVHEGTSRMAARKFLEGPMAEMGADVLQRIKSAVEAAL